MYDAAPGKSLRVAEKAPMKRKTSAGRAGGVGHFDPTNRDLGKFRRVRETGPRRPRGRHHPGAEPAEDAEASQGRRSPHRPARHGRAVTRQRGPATQGAQGPGAWRRRGELEAAEGSRDDPAMCRTRTVGAAQARRGLQGVDCGRGAGGMGDWDWGEMGTGEGREVGLDGDGDGDGDVVGLIEGQGPSRER